jgi:hypothetical protein
VADRIEKYGWVQGTNGHPSMGFCIIGSSLYAAHLSSSPVAEVLAAIADGLPPRSCCDTIQCRISAWNDALDRTKGEVIAALRGIERRLMGEPEVVVVDEPVAEAVEVAGEKPTFSWTEFISEFKPFTFIAASPPKPKPEPVEPERVLIDA